MVYMECTLTERWGVRQGGRAAGEMREKTALRGVMLDYNEVTVSRGVIGFREAV